METPKNFDEHSHFEMGTVSGQERLPDAESIEDELFEMQRFHDSDEVTQAEIREQLEGVEKDLVALQIKYPDDIELKELRLLYDDLRKDFENGQELKLDEGFDELIALMEGEISRSGVRRELVDETILHETVEQLRGVGINPSYVVTQGDPHAKTMIFFMQIHPNPGIDQEFRDAYGVTASQREIYEGILGAQKAGLGRTVYAEGVWSGMPLDKYIDEMMSYEHIAATATFRLEHDLRDQIDTVATEEPVPFFDILMHGGRGFEYRTTAHNIFIADNVADHFKSSDEILAFLPFGAFHETAVGFGEGAESPLPLSQILAYHGLNVVVVDSATPHVDLASKRLEEGVRKDFFAALEDKRK